MVLTLTTTLTAVFKRVNPHSRQNEGAVDV
jgi:hypothetical protein